MNTSKYLLFIREYGLYVGLIVLGFGLMGGGMVLANIQTKSELSPKFESSNSATVSATESTLVVDVAGAVVVPQVYRLPADSRVGEALVAAGGLLPDADGDYVAKNINLAEPLSDGMKIYIPLKGTEVVGGEQYESELISINRATLSQLEDLWGVGEARAEIIIQNRPYHSLDELVTKSGLPKTIIDNNLGKMSL